MLSDSAIWTAITLLRGAQLKLQAEEDELVAAWKTTLSDLTDRELVEACRTFAAATDQPWWPRPGQLRALVPSRPAPPELRLTAAGLRLTRAPGGFQLFLDEVPQIPEFGRRDVGGVAFTLDTLERYCGQLVDADEVSRLRAVLPSLEAQDAA